MLPRARSLVSSMLIEMKDQLQDKRHKSVAFQSPAEINNAPRSMVQPGAHHSFLTEGRSPNSYTVHKTLSLIVTFL